MQVLMRTERHRVNRKKTIWILQKQRLYKMKSQYKNIDNHGGYPQPPAVDVDGVC